MCIRDRLKPRIHDESNGLDYVLVGDYYVPDLKLPEEHGPIGMWGRLHRTYLEPVSYTHLIGTEQKAVEPAEPDNPEPEKKGNAGAILAELLIFAAGGGAAVYFLVLKPKQDVYKRQKLRIRATGRLWRKR